MTQTPSNQLPPPLQIFNMAVLYGSISYCVQAAAFLGIADLLQEGSRSIAELANITHTNPRALYRLIRALSTVGIFEETNTDEPNLEERRFAQSSLSLYLCQNVPGSMYATVQHFGSNWVHKSRGDIMYSIRTGQPATDHIFGKNIWEYLTVDRPDEGLIFNRSMTAFSQIILPSILQAYDFSDIQTLMDVGGGEGELLQTVLQAYPHLQGVLFDQLPEAIESAKKRMMQADLEGRYQLLTGDFLVDLPAVAVDACVLKFILHDWDDQRCVTILKNCRHLLKPGNKLLIIEMVLSNSHPEPVPAFADVEMLLTTYGQERTEQQYRTLIEQSGFSLKRIVPTVSGHSVIEAIADELLTL